MVIHSLSCYLSNHPCPKEAAGVGESVPQQRSRQSGGCHARTLAEDEGRGGRGGQGGGGWCLHQPPVIPGWFMVVTARNCWFCRSSEVANCVNASINIYIYTSLSLSVYIYICIHIYIFIDIYIYIDIYLFIHLYVYFYHWKVYATLDLFNPVLPQAVQAVRSNRQELNDKRAAEEERKQLEMEARQKLEKQLAKEELLGPYWTPLQLWPFTSYNWL